MEEVTLNAKENTVDNAISLLMHALKIWAVEMALLSKDKIFSKSDSSSGVAFVFKLDWNSHKAWPFKRINVN